MLQFLGRGLFRLWLWFLAAIVLLWATAAATLERVMGWNREGWRVRVIDRLMTVDSTVFPAIVADTADLFQSDADGPGWSKQQIPRLWDTCNSIAQKMGCPAPDAIHLSVEPGECCAWASKQGNAPVRRHIALSLLDLRLLSHDEARAVIAHEIAHVGFNHSQRDREKEKTLMIMDEVIHQLPVLFVLPMYLARWMFDVGMVVGSHDAEKEADQKAAEVVGGDHIAWALRRLCVQGPVLARVFELVLKRAVTGQRAPLRLAEASVQVYRSFDFQKLRRKAREEADVAGEAHPALSDRVASAERTERRPGTGDNSPFIDAYPELLSAEELLTKTYFPDMPTHTRSDASQLRRKALAARLKRP